MKMKTLFCVGVLLFGWCALKAAPEGINLLKEPLEIRNKQTTTLKDGVYTIENPDGKNQSHIVQVIELNQEKVLPLTFGAEGKNESYKGPFSGYYGVRLDLVYTDGTKQEWVNTGCFVNTVEWKKAERTYIPRKPVKTATFYLQFIHKYATSEAHLEIV